MRKIVIWILMVFVIWIVISLALSTNDLSSDGFLEFGFPLTVYRAFNGKGHYEVLKLGVNWMNLLISLLLILFISLVASASIKRKT